MTIELPGSLRNISPLMASFRVLNIQKWVWSEHFTPFTLELEALLHAVRFQTLLQYFVEVLRERPTH